MATARPVMTGEVRVRQLVAQRSGGMCERCGNRAAVHKHHRKNRSQRGGWSCANIVDLCLECHEWVGRWPDAAHDEGWHLLPGEDPAKVPVAHSSVPWLMFFLVDDNAAMVVDPTREPPATRPRVLSPAERVARAERDQAAADGCRPIPEALRDMSIAEAAEAARQLRLDYIDRHYTPE